jgi:hypothetical protein
MNEPSGIPTSLGLTYSISWPEAVRSLLFAPEGTGVPFPLHEALRRFGAVLPPGFLPLAAIDEASIAIVAVADSEVSPAGYVFRYFLSEVPRRHQVALLDVDPLLYITSVRDELASRGPGLNRVVKEIGPAFSKSHLERHKRPRDFIVRPIRLASQNVIVGLAAIAQDSSFDGLSVPAWQTCEVPHVATHEGNRALAALTLCDAFQNGGTMEVRFDRPARIWRDGKEYTFKGHPEGVVPASLRRYGRTVGVALGEEDPKAIVPAEARQLFEAVTPMPAELRRRAQAAVATQGIAPERVCFSLLSQVWREIEMDFIMATTSRASSILGGGARWTDRLSRQAESEVCRSAVMVGMLHRRLDSIDNAAATTDADGVVRVVEDRARGVTWHVEDTLGCVTFVGLDTSEPLPWQGLGPSPATLTVLPRALATDDEVRRFGDAATPGAKAVLTPADAPEPALPPGMVLLRCPDRLADLDKDIERRLLKSRISRG